MLESGQDRRAPWAPWEQALLRQHFSEPGGIALVAQKTGRTVAGVRIRANRMGQRKPRNFWSEKDLKILRRHHGPKGWKARVAKLTGRSVSACGSAAQREGLEGKLKHPWTVEEIKVLEDNWPRSARAWRKLLPNRTIEAVISKGKARGLRALHRRGKTWLAGAARAMGFCPRSALKILRWGGVMVLRAKGAPRSHRFTVDLLEAQMAAESWVKSVSVVDAAAALGVSVFSARRALREAGYARPEGLGMRVDPEPDADLARIAPAKRYPGMPWRVDMAMLRSAMAERAARVESALDAERRLHGASCRSLARANGVPQGRVARLARRLGIVSGGQRSGGRRSLTAEQVELLQKHLNPSRAA